MGARYEFIISNKSSNSKSKKQVVAGDNTTDNAQEGGDISTTAKALIAYNSYVKPFVTTIINNRIGTIQLRTGSKQLQQRYEYAYNTITQVGSLVSNTLTGFAVGNVPGAVIGLSLSLGNLLVDSFFKVYNYELEHELSSTSLNLARERFYTTPATYSLSRGNRQ